jgi:hypothetical protein
MLNVSWYCHYSVDNENQVDANDRGFILCRSFISFSAASITSEVN